MFIAWTIFMLPIAVKVEYDTSAFLMMNTSCIRALRRNVMQLSRKSLHKFLWLMRKILLLLLQDGFNVELLGITTS